MNLSHTHISRYTSYEDKKRSSRLEYDHGQEIISNHFHTHDIYLLNISFKYSGASYEYQKYAEDYFQSVTNTIDQRIVGIYSLDDQNKGRCQMIMYPSDKQYSSYRGFLMIPKERKSNFTKRCITSIKPSFNKKLHRTVKYHNLRTDIINPRNTLNQQKSYFMSAIESKSDITIAYKSATNLSFTDKKFLIENIIYAGKTR